MDPTTVWEHLQCRTEDVEVLTQQLEINHVVARLLALRGLNSVDSAARFLNPSLDQLHDPFRLTDLAEAVDRLLVAIDQGERIAIHGDYDVDGVTSTVIVRRMLELLGGKVVHFIPERLRDGYGLQVKAIERLQSTGVTVIVAVDCGIRSHEAALRAKELRVDLIIADHHEPALTLPPGFAVVNPRRSDCQYPDKDLAGVGVALKLVQGLCVKSNNQRLLAGFIKLAAIGTVADVVPLRGENRAIARLGLEQLTNGPNTVGLQALLDSCGLAGKRIGSYEVGFLIAPRVNAAGRMSSPDIAARLLLATKSEMAEEARGLAECLSLQNVLRREEEARILEEARAVIKESPKMESQNILVVWANGWHRGVIGIVASKLTDEFCRPAIVLSVEGDTAHGSGRSVRGFDLLGALDECRRYFHRFGGHKQAAGMVVRTECLEDFRRQITNYANTHLRSEDLVRRVQIDAALPLEDISNQLVSDLRRLEPFGVGNSRPVFFASAVEVIEGPRIVKDRHLSMTVRQGGRRFRAMAWRAAKRADFIRAHLGSLDLAFSLSENTYRGNTSVELSIADVK
jgi:single-stranded-DNA-specific exonuclease